MKTQPMPLRSRRMMPAPSTEHPPANPASGGHVDYFFDVPQTARYSVWARLKAKGNTKWNDSLWIQFDKASVNGQPVYRISTQQALLVNLEDCWACGVQGWAGRTARGG